MYYTLTYDCDEFLHSASNSLRCITIASIYTTFTAPLSCQLGPVTLVRAMLPGPTFYCLPAGNANKTRETRRDATRRRMAISAKDAYRNNSQLTFEIYFQS